MFNNRLAQLRTKQHVTIVINSSGNRTLGIIVDRTVFELNKPVCPIQFNPYYCEVPALEILICVCLPYHNK
ncbi:unnamed protein product [Arctia plantaginis]|uniref:Uncharacterized protein n=1 Tax=Arctia plantaginis TaxID=874455 RepID=A0A8S1BRD3_ARCPL|nr:unnamed protein product [Arctia plantaginis]